MHSVVTGQAGAVEKRTVGNSVSSINAPDQVQASGVGELGALITGRAPESSSLAEPAEPARALCSTSAAAPRCRCRSNRSSTSTACAFPTRSGPVSQPCRARLVSRFGRHRAGRHRVHRDHQGSGGGHALRHRGGERRHPDHHEEGRWRLGEVQAYMRQGTQWFQNYENRMATNYAKDASGNILSWNGAKQETARGTPLFQSGACRHMR